MNIHDQRDCAESEELDLIRKILFPDFLGSFLPPGFSKWNEDQLKHLQYFLAEFCVGYRKRDGTEVFL